MGTCCESKNNEKVQTSTQNYKKPSPQKFYNNQLITNTSNKVSNQKSITTKPTRYIYNKNFTPNDFAQMTQIYLSMLKKMPAPKKTIGQGGQAKVRKYYSTKFKRMVVEKVLVNKGEYEGILDEINLYKEGILLAGLDHPNVVKIYDLKTNPPAIIMEYCEHGSLRNILDTKKLNPLYKIYLIFSICKGLCYVHSQGIVHGDLKCDNILISGEKIGNFPVPKLADFGLGQIRPNKVFAGTLGYIAPEIYKGSGLNFKTDIFALGMVMFEILSGLRPLPSDPNRILSILEQGKIPCTKEVLRRAWELRIEEFLPGVKNDYWDAFYTLMIGCIDDDPEKRPPISAILIIVKKLYEILLEVTIDMTDKYMHSLY